MQASDHYFIIQISIFLLLNNLTDSFSSAVWKSPFQNEPVPSHKCENGGNVQLAKIHSWRN